MFGILDENRWFVLRNSFVGFLRVYVEDVPSKNMIKIGFNLFTDTNKTKNLHSKLF